MDAKLIPEQDGFRPGKSCTSQLLNLTEHIEDGYMRLITGAVFVDLSAAYNTANHRGLLSKVLEMTGEVHLTDLIRIMLERRRFFVVLHGKKSRWRRQRNGLPQGKYSALCRESKGSDVDTIETTLTYSCIHNFVKITYDAHCHSCRLSLLGWLWIYRQILIHTTSWYPAIGVDTS